MKRKLFTLLTGSLLSTMLLVGCNNDNNDQNPPAPNVNNPGDNNLNNNLNRDRDFDLNDNNNNRNLNRNNRNNLNNNDMDLNGDHYSPREDINTDTDKDPAKDSNTKREEFIEDDIDRNDRDRKDE